MVTLGRNTFGVKKKNAALIPRMVQGHMHVPGVQKIIQKQDYSPVEALGEFIDNSFSARIDDSVHIKIEIVKNEHNQYILRIEDDASGIDSESLADVLSYGLSLGKGNNNEHGAGMKQASFAGGTFLQKIESKTTKGSAFKTEFNDADALFAPVQVQPSTKNKRGTLFEINLPATHALCQEEGYARILQRLQVIYQKTLGQSLFITIRNETLSNKKTKTLLPDSPSKYVYNPLYDNNTWLVKDHVLKGLNWSASVNVGYLPQIEEPRLLRKGSTPEFNEGSSYNDDQKGIYIFKKGRLLGESDSWRIHSSLPKAFTGLSDNLKHLVLEVEIHEGISSVPTKNALATPPQSDSRQETPLMELQTALHKYLDRLSITPQPNEKVISPHLLSIRGVHTLMQTIDPNTTSRQVVGPASLDFTGLDVSWRAGWKSAPSFGDWRIWSHPLHEVCLVMHKKGVHSTLIGGDIPNYGVLQDHIESVTNKVPYGIIIAHSKNPLLQQADVPRVRAVHIVDYEDAPARCMAVTKSKLNLEEALPALPRSIQLNDLQRSLLTVSMVSQTKYTLAQAKDWLGPSSKGVEDAKALLQKPERAIVKILGTQEQYQTLKQADSVHAFRRVIATWDGLKLNDEKSSMPNTRPRRSVICLETAVKYNSTVAACEWIAGELRSENVSLKSLYTNLTRGKGLYKGLHWEFYDSSKAYTPLDLNAKPCDAVKEKTGHAVICLETGEVYSTISKAGLWINENLPNTGVQDKTFITGLNNALNNSDGLYKGLHWEFYDTTKKYVPTDIQAKPSQKVFNFNSSGFTGKQIICITNGKIFKSVKDAHKWTIEKLQQANASGPAKYNELSVAINSRTRMFKGLEWAFYDHSQQYNIVDSNALPVNTNLKVYCIEMGRTFGSLTAFATWLENTEKKNINWTEVAKAASGKQTTINGYSVVLENSSFFN